MQVLNALSDMDVIADAVRLHRRCVIKCLIRNCELRMHAHHACDHIRIVSQRIFCPCSILINGFFCLIHAVSVRDFVAEAGADAEIFGSLANLEQRIADVTEAGVVIEDGGDATFDGLDVGVVCAVFSLFQCQVAVDGPPLAIEDVKETFRVVALDGKASGHGAVDMLMHVDKSRHDDSAVCINEFCFRVRCLHVRKGSESFDFCPLYDDSAVTNLRTLIVSCKYDSISYQIHNHVLSPGYFCCPAALAARSFTCLISAKNTVVFYKNTDDISLNFINYTISQQSFYVIIETSLHVFLD